MYKNTPQNRKSLKINDLRLYGTPPFNTINFALS